MYKIIKMRNLLNSILGKHKSDSNWNMIPSLCEYQGKRYRILSIDMQGGYFVLQDLEAKKGDVQVLTDIDMDHCKPIIKPNFIF